MSTSETIDDGGSAFPSMLPGGNYCSPGLSMLDWFAGQAMQGLAAKCYGKPVKFQAMAEECYYIATAMLNAREAIHAQPGKAGVAK